MNGETLSLLGLYQWDNTLFDEVVLPTQINRDDFIFELLAQTAELEVCYTDPDFMKDSLGKWSSIRLFSWQKMADALYKDYDPYINMKRDEVRTVSQTRELFSTDEQNVTAWDSLQSTNVSNNNGSDTGNITTTDNFHTEGDSALYTPTDILGKEVEARKKYDLYQFIIDDFKNRFCLLVY